MLPCYTAPNPCFLLKSQQSNPTQHYPGLLWDCTAPWGTCHLILEAKPFWLVVMEKVCHGLLCSVGKSAPGFRVVLPHLVQDPQLWGFPAEEVQEERGTMD